ncbi:succinate dehydrogenase, cytochrome b556 subunit [Silicimonas sp. MF1-12-2]|jgi:succinate dehydrogenase / fumarate reductase cytochrome b subunit|uniref:succinate dehydrogenase, cytochrome b556 subunit n=1 Tax=Silicimonas sp. MF1-12-2 TaxID=3384793 RepID=UPI0039B4D840
MADVNRGNRPLSPHLSIYRPQMTSISSIFVRITGTGLLVGALLVVWWFLSAATSPEYFAVADGVITSWFGDLIMALSVWALWYHALGGLRHIYWDTGRGLEIEFAEKLGLVMIVLSVVLTVLTLLIV